MVDGSGNDVEFLWEMPERRYLHCAGRLQYSDRESSVEDMLCGLYGGSPIPTR